MEGCFWRALTAFSTGHYSELQLFGAGLHIQLTLVGVGGAVAATHELPRAHALGGTNATAGLRVTDSAERAVSAGLICGREVKRMLVGRRSWEER